MKRSLLRCILLTHLSFFSLVSLPDQNTQTSHTTALKKTLLESWQSIPAEIKELGLVLASTILIAYLTAKIFHTTTTESNNVAWKVYKAGQIKDCWQDIAGMHEAKTALLDIVHFLKHPEKFHAIGAFMPHGILLTGAPGNGKTLLARALAGKAGCNFISVSGSDFVEMYAGVGAARIKQLFHLARSIAPCIIFIDEVDALGRARGCTNGSQEHDHTLNQLLKELDGFESKNSTNVIIMAATNHESMLDPALIRPGRFDRIIHIPMPDRTTREAILKIHLRNIKTDYIDTASLAMQTQGFCCAGLANLINQAAIRAVQKKLPCVSMTELEETIDLLILGAPDTTVTLSPREKLTTAYHEAGHALAHLILQQEHSTLVKITIIPRTNSLGLTYALPTHDRNYFSKEDILTQIRIALAGQAAEELIFQELSTGAHNDFQKATELAQELVCCYGMTNCVGKRIIDQKQCGPSTLNKVDQTIFEILNEQYTYILNLLTQHKEKLEKLAQALFEKETLNAQEIYALCYG